MRKIDLTPKPYSKAELAYMKKLQSRPPDFQFGRMESKVAEYAKAEKERAEEQLNPSTPEYINDWIYNK